VYSKGHSYTSLKAALCGGAAHLTRGRAFGGPLPSNIYFSVFRFPFSIFCFFFTFSKSEYFRKSEYFFNLNISET
jgi:hypothetical protein